MVLPDRGLRLDVRGDKCYTHREKEVICLKKWLAALLLLCLGTGCAISSLAWQRAERQSAQWRARAEAAEHRANEAESALKRSEERRLLLSLESDPIAAFFTPFTYSGSTAGYLAALEAEAYRTEMENAAALLRGGTDSALIDSFLAFIDAQAQMEAEIWTGSLRAQGAATAGAWAHISQCQIPIYRFGAHTLISAYQRTGEDYSFLFDPEAARQTLLLAGFREEDLPELIS